MRPEPTNRIPLDMPAAQGGFALAAAIFLLVVLASLGAFMMHFSSVQQVTSTQDFNGTRAYQAARAGMEWGTYQILKNSGSCAGSTTLPALAGSLAGFSIVVTCSPVTPQPTEGVTVINLYQLTSTASIGTLGSSNYVERRLQATVEK